MMKSYFGIVALLIAILLSSCGTQGSLYLPSKEDSKQQTKQKTS